MAVHLKPYADKRRRIEAYVDAEEARFHKERVESVRALRQRMLDWAHQEKRLVEEAIRKGKLEGRRNWHHHVEGFKRLLQYELFVVEKRRLLAEAEKHKMKQETTNGVEWFEGNMLRLGIGNEENNKAKAGEKVKPTKEDSATFLDRINQINAQGEAVRTREVADMMSVLKEKEKQRAQARREREVRRRKERLEMAEALRVSDQKGEVIDRAEVLMDKATATQKEFANNWEAKAAKVERQRLKQEECRRIIEEQTM